MFVFGHIGARDVLEKSSSSTGMTIKKYSQKHLKVFSRTTLASHGLLSSALTQLLAYQWVGATDHHQMTAPKPTQGR